MTDDKIVRPPPPCLLHTGSYYIWLKDQMRGWSFSHIRSALEKLQHNLTCTGPHVCYLQIGKCGLGSNDSHHFMSAVWKNLIKSNKKKLLLDRRGCSIFFQSLKVKIFSIQKLYGKKTGWGQQCKSCSSKFKNLCSISPSTLRGLKLNKSSATCRAVLTACQVRFWQPD